jgi:hypothetical protein
MNYCERLSVFWIPRQSNKINLCFSHILCVHLSKTKHFTCLWRHKTWQRRLNSNDSWSGLVKGSRQHGNGIRIAWGGGDVLTSWATMSYSRGLCLMELVAAKQTNRPIFVAQFAVALWTFFSLVKIFFVCFAIYILPAVRVNYGIVSRLQRCNQWMSALHVNCSNRTDGWQKMKRREG